MANSIGLIDGGYRGELILVVDNVSDKPVSIQPGTKLVQVATANLSSCALKIVEDLDKTDRGASGFGSTGFNIEEYREIWSSK